MVRGLEIIPKQGNRYGRGPGEERELKLAQLLLLEQGIESKESTKPDEETARAKGMDASLRTTERMGRDRDQFR